jgi:hypothetical protein
MGAVNDEEVRVLTLYKSEELFRSKKGLNN